MLRKIKILIPQIIKDPIKVLFGRISFLHFRLKYLSDTSSSHAQHLEDLALLALQNKKSEGFYIDIGANHPEKINNTKLFYDMGWNGINIEPNPNLIEAFKLSRTRDINLNLGISPLNGSLTFYVLDDDTFSSFNKDFIDDITKRTSRKLVAEYEVKTMPLKEIISTYAKDKSIDFISVDVEGYDLEVLKSNDWDLYRPKFIILELVHNESRLLDYVKSIDYKVVYKNECNSIFKDARVK